MLLAQVQDGLGPQAVLGVIPQALTPREISSELIGDTRVVGDMHERKAAMAAAADGFIAMPGGLGTLEELMEVMTWQQLGFHQKPIGLLNTHGFYDKLLDFVEHAIQQVSGDVHTRRRMCTVALPPAHRPACELWRTMLRLLPGLCGPPPPKPVGQRRRRGAGSPDAGVVAANQQRAAGRGAAVGSHWARHQQRLRGRCHAGQLSSSLRPAGTVVVSARRGREHCSSCTGIGAID